MKTYEERLPLIDAAIEYHKGVWPEYTEANGRYWFKSTGVLCLRSVCGCFSALKLVDVCTNEEFNQRKDELQNKPSFEGHPDAKCFVQQDDGWWVKNTVTSEVRTGNHGDWRWINPSYADGDYGWVKLQQGRVIGSWSDTLEKRPEAKVSAFNAEDYAVDVETNDAVVNPNDWHKRGELPPVGTMVEIADVDGLMYGHGESGEVITHVEKSAVVRMSYGLGCFTAKALRPLRTEAERLLSAAEALIEQKTGEPANSTQIEVLIADGWRPTKPDNHD